MDVGVNTIKIENNEELVRLQEYLENWIWFQSSHPCKSFRFIFINDNYYNLINHTYTRYNFVTMK